MQMRNYHWSPMEKRVARHAFENALLQEKGEVIRAVKERAARIASIDDVWALELSLKKRRNASDRNHATI